MRRYSIYLLALIILTFVITLGKQSTSPAAAQTSLIYSGNGNREFMVDRQKGPQLVRIIGNSAEELFSVDGLEADGSYGDFHLFTFYPYDGVMLISDDYHHVTRFEIEAVGYWQLEFIPIESAQRLNPGESVSGRNDDVVATYGSRELTISANKADRHFAIVAYAANGRYLDLLVNVTYPYDGTVLLPAGTRYLEISATGGWTLTDGSPVSGPTPADSGCVIPPSGPWPPCATSGGGNAAPPPPANNNNDCVIPESGPWPPCATNGSGIAPSAGGANNNDCVIPESGPWPPCATNGESANAPAAANSSITGQSARVTKIRDGDTIEVDINGGAYAVRYIGINSPESNETCGSQATAANRQLVANQWVTLVKDKSEADRYGRLLRYVYVGDRFINAELVESGWAESVHYEPDTKYNSLFDTLESQARSANLGCHPTGVFAEPTPVPTSTPRPQPTAAPPQGNCHPSYPDVCIPPPPPDLDCRDISHRNFRVIGSDPHRFDGDKDGIGCET